MAVYQPYWSYQNGQKNKNPLFDDYSNMILNLKNRSPSAIRYFYRLLAPLADKEVAIAVVPSHDPEKKDSGIHDLAKLMCRKGLWIDATDCLQRTTKIPKLATGGSRSIFAQKNSITVINPELIRDRNVFLLDDVRTTGNTLYACRMLLEQVGASSVNMHSLGETYLLNQRQ